MLQDNVNNESPLQLTGARRRDHRRTSRRDTQVGKETCNEPRAAPSRSRGGFVVAEEVDGVGCVVVAPGRVGRGNEAPREHCRERPCSEIMMITAALLSPPLAVLDHVVVVGRIRPRPRLHGMEASAVAVGDEGFGGIFRSGSEGEGGTREREEEKREKEEEQRGQQPHTMAETHERCEADGREASVRGAAAKERKRDTTFVVVALKASLCFLALILLTFDTQKKGMKPIHGAVFMAAEGEMKVTDL
ncbi:hypothetical protein MUK42_24829 [Musa troglodytarum]|uniref:Uncharacterized protein n=1 Tax=Musa troglodytarum TaxID=320322 RepID=A0A9E7I6Z1_9LILI|nr:hypothetical protein MUK42_24829 [Musa troglodytarum]